jgi:hypothetical protein
MDGKTVMIVPATVPDAKVVRMHRAEPVGPVVSSAHPEPVPAAQPIPVFPEQLTTEQVDQLREENSALRDELSRLRNA